MCNSTITLGTIKVGLQVTSVLTRCSSTESVRKVDQIRDRVQRRCNPLAGIAIGGGVDGEHIITVNVCTHDGRIVVGTVTCLEDGIEQTGLVLTVHSLDVDSSIHNMALELAKLSRSHCSGCRGGDRRRHSARDILGRRRGGYRRRCCR